MSKRLDFHGWENTPFIMRKMIGPRARLEKYLKKHLPLFRFAERFSDVPQLASHELPSMAGETLLGVYENFRGSKEDLVLFSDRAVHWRTSGKWSSVDYRDIASIGRREGEKMSITDLLLTTRIGEVKRLPIRGGTENSRDAYTVWSYLLSVTRDLKRMDSTQAPA